MDLVALKKLTYTINTAILGLVIMLAGFFWWCKADFLVWFSIPTALVYIIGYVLISRNMLYQYIKIVYFWLTLYMTVTTICLGTGFGFHLYCLSMIPIIFYTEYMGGKLGSEKTNALFVSAVIIICYLGATVYSAFVGAVYDADPIIAGVSRFINSLIVIGFLVYYSRLMLKMVRDSETQLAEIALKDQLTGLYNRHYMITKLEAVRAEGKESFLAMADIDDFKQINDTYGHNAGDYILRGVARIMKDVCSDSIIARWGGEEFLILTSGKAGTDGMALIEKLRSSVENEDFVFDGTHIKVTITAGLSGFSGDRVIDRWISEADDNLYYGKKHGKNTVINNHES